jgi:hypothetical protein
MSPVDAKEHLMQHDRSNRGRTRKSLGLSVAALGIFVGSAYAHPVAPPTAPVRALHFANGHKPGLSERLLRRGVRVSIAGRPVANLSPYASVGIGGHAV